MDTAAAYRHCRHLAASHYENFPVASRLLPRHLRDPVAAIYAFARHADDLADEGDLDTARRYHELDAWGAGLDAAVGGHPPDNPVFIALADAIPRHTLPPALFHDLLRAFRWDVEKKRYRDFAELREYCRCSADPVGRLLLHLDGAADEENLQLSDCVCTSLQLINFLQDVAQDYEENGRIYIPAEDMAAHGVSEADIAARRNNPAMRRLLVAEGERARCLMLAGKPLGRRLRGRLGLEIRLIVEGGLAVLGRLQGHRNDLFDRPRLRRRDWVAMLARALLRL